MAELTDKSIAGTPNREKRTCSSVRATAAVPSSVFHAPTATCLLHFKCLRQRVCAVANRRAVKTECGVEELKGLFLMVGD